MSAFKFLELNNDELTYNYILVLIFKNLPIEILLTYVLNTVSSPINLKLKHHKTFHFIKYIKCLFLCNMANIFVAIIFEFKIFRLSYQIY